MRPYPPHPRGMALVMAMIVVVLVTMLVAGAISFTGTERAASEVQSQQDEMSACVQAARNLFVAQLRMTMTPETDGTSLVLDTLPISFDQDFVGQPNRYDGTPQVTELRSGHVGDSGTAIRTAKKVTALEDPMAAVGNLNSVTGFKSPPTFYTVSAVCRQDKNDPGSPQREVEFIVRVGYY